ncbi:Cupredoxins domain-containing protein [Dioscorea alata]|uniref:Cupredoxins domain-containing protein n=1 Tax=Dioscorea alata TaxID=55571 RepID=A0ACB7UBG0_DIOAL|nr:Cupredoxins domain-containing protein [Dioscorea alata]
MNPLLILFILTMITTTIKASKEFNVGDDSGWQVLQKNNSNMYLKWADKNTFHVGDSLVFKYQNNSVVMVDKRGYYHCNHSSHDRVFDDGNTVFVLDKPGFYYFESGDFQHCKNGQRLMINVKDSNLKVSSFGVSSSVSPFLVLIVFISTVTGLDLIHAMTH